MNHRVIGAVVWVSQRNEDGASGHQRLVPEQDKKLLFKSASQLVTQLGWENS